MEGLILRGRDEQLSLFDEPELASEARWLPRASGTSPPTARSAREPSSRRRRSRWTRSRASSRRSRAAIGSGADVRGFVEHALRAEGATSAVAIVAAIDLAETPRALRDLLALGEATTLRADFELPVPDGVTYLSRTHPLVEGSPATSSTRRSIRSSPVARRERERCARRGRRRTTLLLVRMRFDVVTTAREDERRQLAEETRLLAFEGRPEAATGSPTRTPPRCSTPSRTATSRPSRPRLRPNGGRRSRSARAASRRDRRRSGARRSSTRIARVREARESAVAPTRSSRSSRSTCSGFTSSSPAVERSR